MMNIKLIGIGGIGGHLAPNLCRFLHAGRRAAHITLVDGDVYEERNRARMSFRKLGNKAVVLGRQLAAEFGDGLSVEPLPEYVTPDNVAALIAERAVVFLAVDNHATRQLIDRRCAELRNVTLFSGGNDGVDDGKDGTYGNVQVLRRLRGKALTSSLSRFHPEIETPSDRSPHELGCAELAQAGAPQLLFTNLAVAAAMLNAFHAWLRDQLTYEEVYVDIGKNRVVPVERRPPG